MSEESISTRLRQAREQKGKTHEQIHKEAAFSLNVRKAVEYGKFKVVEPVYIRLVLRAYAEYLGLDGAQIVQQYNDQFGGPLPPLKVPPPPTPPPHPQVPLRGEGMGERTVAPPWQPAAVPPRPLHPPEGSRTRIGLLAAGVIGLFLLLLLGIQWLDQEEPAPQARAPAFPRPEPVPQRPMQLPEEGQPPAEGAGVAQAPARPAADTAAARPVAQVPDKTAVDTAAARPVVAPPVPSAPAAAGQEPAPGALVLELEAVEPTWVRVRWDKGGFLEAMLQPGTTRRLEARRQFLVWSGNSRGLRYRFQGRPIEQIRPGDPSHTVRFRASAEGVVLLDREKFEQLSQDARDQDTAARARRDSVP